MPLRPISATILQDFPPRFARCDAVQSGTAKWCCNPAPQPHHQYGNAIVCSFVSTAQIGAGLRQRVKAVLHLGRSVITRRMVRVPRLRHLLDGSYCMASSLRRKRLISFALLTGIHVSGSEAVGRWTRNVIFGRLALLAGSVTGLCEESK